MSDRIPAEVFPPGEFLRDELDERGWSQTEFAGIIGRPVRVVNEIIAGKVQITPKTATEFAAALGTSAIFWLNLETAYQLSKVDPAPERIGREAALREKFPVKELIKRGWIVDSENFDVLETRVFEFYNVANLNDEVLFSHAARRNHSLDISILQLTWLLRVKHLASSLVVPRYSEASLRATLTDLEKLMLEPEEVRHVPRLLTECGVRFVVVEPVPGSKIEGVCFWIDSGKSPVIGLTMKTDRIDNFWFNLRHEIEHVLQGDGKDQPQIDETPYGDSPSSTKEVEDIANKAAASFCAPQDELMDFVLRHDPIFPENGLIGFARIMKRHPGLIAGQVHHVTGKFFLYKKFMSKVRLFLTETALTDGYGHTVQ